MKTGSPLAPWVKVVRVVALALSLAGLVMICTDTALAFPVIALGVALAIIVNVEERRQSRTSH